MSNTDSFIEEVTEEVRRDRLFSLFRRWGWLGLLIVVLIVGGTAWNEWQKSRQAAAAQAAGDALLTAMSAGEPGERAAGLAAVGPAGPVGALLLAGQQQLTGDTAAAVATLDGLSADAAAPSVYRDLARLRSLMLQAETMPSADRIAALQGLAAPGATFAGLAQEQIAVAQAQAGEIDAALATLTAILDDAATPQGLRVRADALMVALGGGQTAAAGQD